MRSGPVSRVRTGILKALQPTKSSMSVSIAVSDRILVRGLQKPRKAAITAATFDQLMARMRC
jgi:hypothetical protein